MEHTITVDMAINNENNLASAEVQNLIDQALTTNTTPVSTRPQRASKSRALSKIQDIHEWENCSENSKLFKQVEEAINEEFDSLRPEERCVKDDEESEYSQSEEESDDNLSFIDPDSDAPNNSESWSAAESEPETETEDNTDDETDDETDDTDSDHIPRLRREPATALEELNEITSPSMFFGAVTPTRDIDDLPAAPVADTLPSKRKRDLVDSDGE
tara:strand:- start:18015 stop:18662 length:648 start_codon:yes stop_codon:yes gene_type:complete